MPFPTTNGIQLIHGDLWQACDVDGLVNSDNTLTPLGDKVQYCYAGGAFLGLLGGLEALRSRKIFGG